VIPPLLTLICILVCLLLSFFLLGYGPFEGCPLDYWSKEFDQVWQIRYVYRSFHYSDSHGKRLSPINIGTSLEVSNTSALILWPFPKKLGITHPKEFLPEPAGNPRKLHCTIEARFLLVGTYYNIIYPSASYYVVGATGRNVFVRGLINGYIFRMATRNDYIETLSS
jgi:hypothetical protein